MSETSIEIEDNEKFSFNWFIIFIGTQIIFVVIIFFFVKQFCNDMLSLNEKNLQMNKTLIEQIEIAPIKDKTGKISFNMNIDEMKKTVNIGYTENHSKFMQAYYETQSNWLNFWMTFLGILFAFFGLVIPLSFIKLYETKARELTSKHENMLKKIKQIEKTSEETEKRISAQAKQAEKKLGETEKTANVTMEKIKIQAEQAEEVAAKREKTIKEQAEKAEKSARQAKESEEFARAQSLFYEALNSSDLNEKIEKYSKEIAILEKHNNSMDNYYNLATAYNNRGIAYRNLANYNNAMEDLMKSLYLSPYEASTYANITEVYLDVKRHKEAEKNLKKAKKYDNQNDTELTDFIKELEERLEKERPKD